MEIGHLLELIASAVMALGIIIYCIVMAIKNKWISQLYNTIKTACGEAEKKYPEPGSGEKKKAYVIAAVKAKCDELKIPYELLKKLISALIDKIVDNYNSIKKA